MILGFNVICVVLCLWISFDDVIGLVGMIGLGLVGLECDSGWFQAILVEFVFLIF